MQSRIAAPRRSSAVPVISALAVALLALLLLVPRPAAAAPAPAPAAGAPADPVAPAAPATDGASLPAPHGIVPPRRALGASAAAAGPGEAGTAHLTYHGGPVLRTNTTYLIFWLPAGSSVSSGYVSTITGFFQNVARSSGSLGNVYAVNSQYYDTTGRIAHTSVFGGAATVTNAFPASGCTDPAGRPVCLSDAQLQAQIRTAMAAQGWTPGPNKLFFIFTPRNVGSCYSAGACAYREFCAYHSAAGSGASVLVYANQPYAGGVGGCDTGQHPNGDDADGTINVASHEHNEAITDPQLNAWFDDATGNENGDICAWTFGTPLGGSNGSYWNQAIGTGRYYLQREWSNATSSCVLGMGAGDAASFTVTGPTTVVAGAAGAWTVTAKDAAGLVAGSFRGTVTLTSGDGSATLPAAYTFTSLDAGTHVFRTPVLRTLGSQTVTATSGSITGSATTTVAAGTISRFTVSGPATAGAGTGGTYTVTALNAAGARISNYTGTVHFTSTDSAAVLPSDTVFESGDAGQRTFTVAFRTSGSRAVGVRDTVTTAATSSASVTVASGTATHLAATAAATTLAGAAVPVTVVARDAYENRATGFRGAVTLSSGDEAATLPGTYTFTATDAGSHAFATPVLRTAGSQSIAAAASGLTGGSVSISVSAGTVSRFTVAGPSTLAAGSSGTWTVTALNAAGYRLAGYRGSVRLTSTDAAAELPAATAFSEGDAGQHAFTVTLKTSGSRTITARDTVATAATGTASTTVTPGTGASFTVTTAATTLAGAALRVTVVAKDANGNVATGFRGIVHLASSDGAATLPADYTFTALDSGTHIFTTPVLRTAGSQTVTATSGEASGTATTTVSAGAVSRFTVTGPSSVTSGTGGSFTVTALNAAGLRLTSYRGTVHFLSSDTLAGLPADTAFSADDAGQHVFTVTPRSSGPRTLGVRDTVVTAATGTTSFTVVAGTAATLAVTLAPSATAGSATNVIVVARDADGNLASGFRGTVHLSSSDTAATFGTDYAFSPSDSGTHTFTTAVLRTAGAQRVTVTADGLTASATTTVQPGAVTRFAVSAAPSAGTGRPLTVTVTALDGVGNIATGFRGTVRLTSSDGAAVLGPDYAFSEGDAGAHAFTVTLGTAGSQTVTVRSTLLSSITGFATTAVS